MNKNLLFSIVMIAAMVLSACGTVSQVVPTVTFTNTLPILVTPTPDLGTATPEAPAISPFPVTLADFEKNKLSFATCFNTPDAAGACTTYDAALQKSLENFSWFPTTGTVSEQYAAMSMNNKGEYLALPTGMFTHLVSVEGYIQRGPTSETIDEKFYGFGFLKDPSTRFPGKNVFEDVTTDVRDVFIYMELFGNKNVVIPRGMLVISPSGNLGDIILLPGDNPNYKIASIVMPDGTFISAGVVNLIDGVQYEAVDNGTSLWDLSGRESIQLTTKINSQSNKGEIDITPAMLEWLIDQDAYVQAQPSRYFLRGVKEWARLIITDDMYAEMLKQPFMR